LGHGAADDQRGIRFAGQFDAAEPPRKLAGGGTVVVTMNVTFVPTGASTLG
jgi:hypothetical protein